MKERPILMNGAMVRATLGGSKKQTRRVVKLPHMNKLGEWEPTTIGGPSGGRTKEGITIPEQGVIWHARTGDCIACPHGMPGDRLWVRETCRAEELEPGGWDGVRYIADDHWRVIENTREAADAWVELNSYRGEKGAVVPSIHMPRWASRILLKITGVRVERLQDISEEDAIAEGVYNLHGAWYVTEDATCACAFARGAYKELWESINGTGSWDANPWVWVIEFEVIK